MRAKMYINSVTRLQGNQEKLELFCVCSKAFGPNGESEDNTFARFSPSGELKITISNPNLIGKFSPGQKFYLDFTEAKE